MILYLDYRAPIAIIRDKVRDIVTASPHWDEAVQVVQVTDFKEHAMEVRILASAPSAPAAFDLRCEFREKLIEFLQAEHPEALPRFRVEGPQSPSVIPAPSRPEAP